MIFLSLHTDHVWDRTSVEASTLLEAYQLDAGAPSARERGGAGDGRHSRTAGFGLLVLIPSDLCVRARTPGADARKDAAVCPEEPRLG